MQIIHIGDITLPELWMFRERSEVQLIHANEPEPGIFIAETSRVIKRALDAGYEPVCLLAEEHAFKAEMLRKEDRIDPEKLEGIPVYVGTDAVLCKLTGYHLTRGLLCAMKRRRPDELEDIIKDASRIVILEAVMNPINVGAIFRSAAAMGMDAVILTCGSSDPLYRRSVRVSMGTVFTFPWTIYSGETSELLAELKCEGYFTAAMALKEDALLLGHHDLTVYDRLAAVLGTEGDGLKEETIAACDMTIKIPMERGVDSLNVAAASAVLCWELRKECEDRCRKE